MQFVTFDCDSAIKYFHDTISLTHSFKVPCPPSYSRVDTFKITTTIVKKDSASNYLSQLELSKLREKTITQAEKISKQSRHILHLSLILIGIGVIFGIGLFLKLKK